MVLLPLFYNVNSFEYIFFKLVVVHDRHCPFKYSKLSVIVVRHCPATEVYLAGAAHVPCG